MLAGRRKTAGRIEKAIAAHAHAAPSCRRLSPRTRRTAQSGLLALLGHFPVLSLFGLPTCFSAQPSEEKEERENWTQGTFRSASQELSQALGDDPCSTRRPTRDECETAEEGGQGKRRCETNWFSSTRLPGSFHQRSLGFHALSQPAALEHLRGHHRHHAALSHGTARGMPTRPSGPLLPLAGGTASRARSESRTTTGVSVPRNRSRGRCTEL